MILRFGEWLVDQQSREDHVGDLARAPTIQAADHKHSGRKPDEHRNWADIVIGIAQPGYVEAFNEAWQEFLLARQAAKDLAD